MRSFTIRVALTLTALTALLLFSTSLYAQSPTTCYLPAYLNLDRGLDGQPDYTGWTIPAGWLASKNVNCEKSTLRFSTDSLSCNGYSKLKSKAISPLFEGKERNVVQIKHKWGWNQFNGQGIYSGGAIELSVGSVWYKVEAEDFETGPDLYGYNMVVQSGASCGEERSVFGLKSPPPTTYNNDFVTSRVDLDKVCVRVTGQESCKGFELRLGFLSLADCQAGGADNLGWQLDHVRVDQCEIEGGNGDFFFLPTPCRLLDTRLRPEGKIKAPGEWIAVEGKCGLPVHVLSTILNVTMISPAKAGWYLFDVEEGTEGESLVKRYYEAGKNRATGVQIIEVDNRGRGIYVQTAEDIHMVLDVSGFIW
jgi:hypothetical protein